MTDHSYRVLVVEDSATQALQLRLGMEQLGWESGWATTAEAALDELTRDRPDLLVVDHNLPGMNGDELCRQVRSRLDTRGIPILMLTAEEGEAAELKGLESGADDYVVKSEDERIVLLRIRALLRRSTPPEGVLACRDRPFRQIRVLAVDDSPTFVLHLSEALGAEGYFVATAGSGEEALELLGREAFDCVLLDLVMPDMDGAEACRRIIERRGAPDEPTVMMLTAHDGKEQMGRGLESGADDFVVKSEDLTVLKARMRAVVRRKLFLEENRRIARELTLERAEREAAEQRAELADELRQANRKLKETQAQLVQSEKMASLGQLVAGIAHEVNNPLSFALNNLFTLRRGVERITAEAALQLSDAGRREIDKMKTRIDESQIGLERVQDLVVKLRTFSRLDEGDFKTIDVHESIDSVLLFLRYKMGQRIHVGTEYHFDRPLACYAGQLNQVFMNLLSNAVDAIEGEGTITIRTNREGDQFVARVSDTGCGMSEAVRQQIFDPFFTTKEIGKGTGLGLAICYGIVEAHRGSIEVQSREGAGTEFVVRIPLES